MHTRSSCAIVASIDYGSFISEDVGINEAGWRWFCYVRLGNVVILSRQ